MPLVRMRTGLLDEDGREKIFSEYLCDWPGCAKVAEHGWGVVRELGWVSFVCDEHAAKPPNRGSDPALAD